MKLRAVWLIAALWAMGALGLARAGGAYSAATATASATATATATAPELSREQAAQEIQKRYGAGVRVVRSDVVDQNGRRIYVFRLLSGSGKVWIVRVDARSGAEVP